MYSIKGADTSQNLGCPYSVLSTSLPSFLYLRSFPFSGVAPLEASLGGAL